MKDIYQKHPKWIILESLCSQIETLKRKAKKLREEIDKDIFSSQKPNGGSQ